MVIDPAIHRREQVGRSRARILVQSARSLVLAGAELPRGLLHCLPKAAAALRDHHGSTVPAVVEQLLMGSRDYEKSDSEGWRQKRGKQQRGSGGKGSGGKDGKAKLHDYNELPELKGKNAYVACKCRAWFWAYGITEVSCTHCGKHFGNNTLQACVDTGAVIAGFAGRSQTSERRGVPSAQGAVEG